MGNEQRRTGKAHAVIAPYGVFQTLDGPLNLAPITSAIWGRLCVLLDLPELPGDRRFISNEARVERRDELNAILESRLKPCTKRDWSERFIAAGLPAGPINTLDEVFADPHVLHSRLTQTVEHPTLGTVRQVVAPVFSAAESSSALRPPPLLGEHSVEVLQQAGFAPASIQSRLNACVLFQAPEFDSHTGTAS
ncbi:CoA transferase [Pseudomonas sp. D47]|uniref:CoA transferase n=1 Tax=Pseudomonas sp. D47 TaxID=3159447 RepID=UPI00387AF373